MDESNLHIFKRYVIHTFLQWFAHSVFVAFGVLFIYIKTQSIGWALAAGFVGVVADLIVRSPLIDWWWNSLMKGRQIMAMMIGMVITACSALGIFFVDTTGSFSAPLLLMFVGLGGIGGSIYWIPSNAVFFNSVGNSTAPGKYTAIIAIVRIVAAMLAALVGLALNTGNNFLFLLPIVTVTILLSLVPLRGVELSIEGSVSWRRALHTMSWKNFWANCIGDSQIRASGIPLMLVLLYGSVSKPISIGALTLLLAAVLGYFAGTLKDKNNAALFAVALVGIVFAWAAYAVMKAPIGFVVLGAVEHVFATVVNVGRDARIGRETANGGHPIESALGVEFARAVGTMAGLLILIGAYVITSTLPQYILLVGALFVLPRGLYALGVLDELKGAVSSPRA